MSDTNKQAKAQQLQHEIDNNLPFDVKVGNKTFKVKYLTSYCSSRFSYEISKKLERLSDGTDITKVLKCVAENATLAPKCLSIVILGSYIKIKLFHWIFWRWLHFTKTNRELYIALESCFTPLDLGFFLTVSELLENMNYLTMKMTKAEAKLIRQELKSEANQTS